MSQQFILAIDQGTTGTTALVVNTEGSIVGRGYLEHQQYYPATGWVEHDADEIWRAARSATTAALEEAGVSAGHIAAVSITNQRETVVPFSAQGGDALAPAIVWQDRRTADFCNTLTGHSDQVRETTGLPINPYFSASKMRWLIHESEDVTSAAKRGDLRFGTIDTWLVWKMTGGTSHVTDPSNASRTLLWNIHRQEWSQELLELFDISADWLPQVHPSSGLFGETNPSEFCGISAPICGIAGDQQAALFGQACFSPGEAKITYGTGGFILVNNGETAPVTQRLLTTAGWQIGDAPLSYALEGTIFTAGAVVQWLRDQLGIIESAAEVEELAGSVADADGVTVVPAFAGLGSPWWDSSASASITNIKLSTSKAHIARAAIEGVAFQVAETVEAMAEEGSEIPYLRADGGMTQNNLFMQLQADILDMEIQRSATSDATGLGSAFLAGLHIGMWDSTDQIAELWSADATFTPGDRAWVEPARAAYDKQCRIVRAQAPVTA